MFVGGGVNGRSIPMNCGNQVGGRKRSGSFGGLRGAGRFQGRQVPRWVEAMLVTPGLADNLDAVAMLREAIDERADAGGAWKNLAPLFVAEVGGDDRRAFFVAARQNIVEHVGGARITRQVA